MASVLLRNLLFIKLLILLKNPSLCVSELELYYLNCRKYLLPAELHREARAQDGAPARRQLQGVRVLLAADRRGGDSVPGSPLLPGEFPQAPGSAAAYQAVSGLSEESNQCQEVPGQMSESF